MLLIHRTWTMNIVYRLTLGEKRNGALDTEILITNQPILFAGESLGKVQVSG